MELEEIHDMAARCRPSRHMKAVHLAYTPEEVAQAMKEAEILCAKRGGEMTPLRKKALRHLLELTRPAKAYDLLKALKENGQAKPPTVYRTLDFLIEMRLVHRIESLQAFLPCRHWKYDHAVVFLICDGCGAVTELDAAESVRKLTKAAADVNFKARNAVVEVRGICADCRG